MEKLFKMIAKRLKVCKDVISRDGIKFRGEGPYLDEYGYYTRDSSGYETENWKNSKLRLLEVTKDLNDVDPLDIRQETGLKNHTSTKIIGCRWYRNLMRWEFLLIQFFNKGIIPPFESLNEGMLIDSFNAESTARINVKKKPGGGTCSDTILNIHIKLYGDLIIQQIQALNPNIIFIGGCSNNRILKGIVIPVYPDLQAVEDNKWIYYSPKSNVVVIHGYNPTPIGKKDEEIYMSMSQALKSFAQTEFYSNFISRLT